MSLDGRSPSRRTGNEAITKNRNRYHTCSGANGRGLYTPEGFVVLKDSTGRKENVDSIKCTAAERLRTNLLDSGVMKTKGDQVVFTKDHLINSPSTAALAIMGRTANGWIEWKTKEGKTLDLVKRQIPG